MLAISIVTLLIAVIPSLAIPPPDFGFPEAPNHTELSVTYQNNGNPIVVGEAALFGISIPADEPAVAVETSNYDSIASYHGSYVLLMVDPDARYPSNPTLRWMLHWLQTDMNPSSIAADGTSQLVNSTAPRVPYRRPSPPNNSSAHRYIFYAFFQHENFTIPSDFEGLNATNRTNFNLTAFLDQSNLGQTPAAAMYFFASNQTQVPQDFTAAGGGVYPGGNGDMITAGPGPSITPSTTSATATSTGSPSVTSASDSGSSESRASSGSETASSTGPAASASGSNDAIKTSIGSGTLFAGLMALLNMM